MELQGEYLKTGLQNWFLWLGATRGRSTPARAVLYVEVTCDALALHHHVEYTTEGNDAAPRDVDGGPVEVSRAPPVILGAPLRGGPWAAVHEPAWPRGHRRVIYTVAGTARIPGRYAIDWIALGRRGHEVMQLRALLGTGGTARDQAPRAARVCRSAAATSRRRARAWCRSA